MSQGNTLVPSHPPHPHHCRNGKTPAPTHLGRSNFFPPGPRIDVGCSSDQFGGWRGGSAVALRPPPHPRSVGGLTGLIHPQVVRIKVGRWNVCQPCRSSRRCLALGFIEGGERQPRHNKKQQQTTSTTKTPRTDRTRRRRSTAPCLGLFSSL